MNTNLDLTLEMLEDQEAPVTAGEALAYLGGVAAGVAIGIAIT